MDSLDEDTMMKVWDIMESFTPATSLCKCSMKFTVAVHLTGDIVMSNDSVMANAIIFDAEMMPSTFCGRKIHASNCECERITAFPVKFPMWQWDLMQREYQSLILVGASWLHDIVDMSLPHSAVLPAPWHEAFHFCMDKTVSCFEMFAGGFGGWSHAIEALSKNDIPICTSCALDRDDWCCKAFVKTHHFDVTARDGSQCYSHIQNCEERGLNPKIFFHTSMEDIWWMTILKRERVDMWCMSPPCPPWSCIDLSAGLRRIDGRNLVFALMLASIARPKVIALENVATLVTHRHWGIIKELFGFIGYHIRWCKTLDLSDVLPQRRERLLIVAIDGKRSDLMPFMCQMWPAPMKHSFRTYAALIDLTVHERWLPNSRLTNEELQLYMDPINLPKDAKVTGHAKRSCRDVVRYRLRTVDDKSACILTSYGFPTNLHSSLIQRGGIYGSLVLEGGKPRKMTIPELLILMGLVGKTWMPSDVVKATFLIGNAISIPHALIAILNGMMYLEATHVDVPIQEIFADIVGKPVNARNIVFHFEDDGVWIGKSDQEVDDSLATQPMIALSHLVVQSPTESFTILCQEGIPVKEMLQSITGPSMPLNVDLELSQEPKLKMPISEQMKMDNMDLKVITNVPSRFMMDEIRFSSYNSSFIVVLTGKLPIVILRTRGFMIQDLHVVLSTAGIELGESCAFVGVSHQPFGLQDLCPDAIFVIRSKEVVTFTALRKVQDCLFLNNYAVFWNGTSDLVLEVYDTLRKIGIVDVLSCLGWHFTMTIPTMGQTCEVTMFLTIKPGQLPTTFQTAKSMCIMMTFLMLLPPSLDASQDTIFVRIKIWNSVVWKGFVHKTTKGEIFTHAWEHAAKVFHTSGIMRLVAKGTQMNPDWNIGEYVVDDHTLTIHLVEQLFGGGPRRHVDSMDHRDIHEIPSSRDVSMDDPLEVEHESLDDAVALLLDEMRHRFPSSDRLDLSQFAEIHFVADGIRLCASGTVTQVLRVMQTFHCTGIETMLHNIGWIMVLQMTHYGQPSKANLLLLPMPRSRTGSISLVQAFLVSILTVLTLPVKPDDPHDCIRVQLKLWGSWVFDRLIHKDVECEQFLVGWETISTFIGKSSQMRLVSRGRRVNPDYTIERYIHRSRNGDIGVKMFFVLELRGGGGSTPTADQITKLKNGIASLMLEHGCDLGDTSQFVGRILAAAGHAAIDQILKQKGQANQIMAMQALSKALNITMPDGSKLHTLRQNQVQRMLQKKGTPVVTLNPSDYVVKTGFLCNEDDTPCVQRECFRGSSTGFSLMDAETAKQWINQGQLVSQDELGILVVGKCPVEGGSKCHRVGVPVFDKQDQPCILDCCLHQMGHKKIKVKALKTMDISISATFVLAFTIFRDEVDEHVWEQLVVAPIRTLFDLLATTDVKINLPSPPWGRSWRDVKGKTAPAKGHSSVMLELLNLTRLIFSRYQVKLVCILHPRAIAMKLTPTLESFGWTIRWNR